MGLGLLFILIFNAYALAIHQSGVGLATIFQKMSLISPVLVALIFYNESFTMYKAIGLALSIFALFLLSFTKKKEPNKIGKGLKILLIVFFGSCIIDTTFYLAEAEKLAPGADVGFISSLFFFSMVFGLIYMFIIKRNSLSRFNKKSIIGGLILGIPNFFSIYLLLKVIAMGWEGSVVFPANNVGVLSIAALFGVFMFKEEVTNRKIIGFISAVTSIILLSLNS
jgi:multidrug transporter EmrE-like cation transporter